MIPTRFRRLVGAALALALAPSLAPAQTALQQPAITGNRDTIPAAVTKLYQNDLFLQGLIGTRFGQLGSAAFLNVGTLAGTVADGGALANEVTRAQAAEQASATAILLRAPLASPTFTGVPRAPTAATGATGTQLATLDFVAAAVAAMGGGAQYAVTFVSQSLTAPQQLQARSNISAAASGANTDILSLNAPALGAATATTAAAGDSTTKVATTAFATGALMNYAGTVSATFAPLASPTFTGTPKAPTAALGDNSTTLATTAYVDRVASGAVRSDTAQAFTADQQNQARRNIYAAGLNNARVSWIRQAEILAAPMPLFDAAADGFASNAGIDTVNSLNATVQNGTVVNQANDTFTTALIDFNGANNATTVSDYRGHTVTFQGTAKLSTAVSGRFGATSLYLDGSSGAGVLIGPSSDFAGLTQSGTWTIETWYYPTSTGSAEAIFGSGSGSGAAPQNNVYRSGTGLVLDNGSAGNVTYASVFTTANQWYKVEQVNNGGTLYTFVNGTLLSPTVSAQNYGTPDRVRIGNRLDMNYPATAYFGQTRVSVGKARHTASYTPETSALTVGTSGNLDLRSIAYSAAAVPTKGSLLLLVKTQSGSTALTPNTNFTVGMRRDSAASWASGTVVNTGQTIGGYSVLTADDIDLTFGGAAANTNVQYRAQTSDTGLSLAIDGVAVGWR